MQIFSLHWMMQTLGFLMSVKPEGLLGDIKTLMFCIIQCKLKIWISILIFTFYIINQTNFIIFDPNWLVILEKWNILIVTEVLEQPANESPVHNVVALREWRHANVDKQRKLLVDVDVTPPRGATQTMWLLNVLHREMQAARNYGFI